jgi:hypothetical protein
MLSQAGEYLAQTMTINGVPLSDGIYTKQMFERPNTMAEAAFSERTIETLIEMSVAGMADGETVNVVLPRAFMDYGKTLSTLSVQNRKAAHVFQEEYKWYQFPRSYDYEYDWEKDEYYTEYCHYEGLTWVCSSETGDNYYSYFDLEGWLWDFSEFIKDDVVSEIVEEIWEEKVPAYEEIVQDWLEGAQEQWQKDAEKAEAWWNENMPGVTEWLSDTADIYDELTSDRNDALEEQFLNDALDAAGRLEQITRQAQETAE